MENHPQVVQFEDVKELVGEVLHLGDRTEALGPETPLLGSLPELDSIAVVALVSALEEHFHIHIPDDEISAETFETFGQLHRFVCQKVAI